MGDEGTGRLGDWETGRLGDACVDLHHSPNTSNYVLMQDVRLHPQKLEELSGIIDRYVVVIFKMNGIPFSRKNLFLCVRHKQWKALELALGSLNYSLD